jgi:hypothetical protein
MAIGKVIFGKYFLSKEKVFFLFKHNRRCNHNMLPELSKNPSKRELGTTKKNLTSSQQKDIDLHSKMSKNEISHT